MNTMLQAAAGANNYSFLIMMVVIFAIMWLFMIRPQQKKQKELQNFRNQITVVTEIITAGGIYVKVTSIDETNNILIVEVSKGVTIRVDRNSVFKSAQDNQK